MPRQSLKSGANGDLLLAVPRKALLQISAKSDEHLTVSLYRQDDPTFRIPPFRNEVRGGSSLKIPSGDHVVSLAAPGRAPDLHFLSAKPGASERLAYRPRSGWSLVVRSRAEKDGDAVVGAQVTVGGMEGFSGKLPGAASGVGENGLVLFSGLSYGLASAGIEHPRFVLHREEGIAASPGTRVPRGIAGEGGRLRVTVSLEPTPLQGSTAESWSTTPIRAEKPWSPRSISEPPRTRRGSVVRARLRRAPTRCAWQSADSDPFWTVRWLSPRRGDRPRGADHLDPGPRHSAPRPWPARSFVCGHLLRHERNQAERHPPGCTGGNHHERGRRVRGRPLVCRRLRFHGTNPGGDAGGAPVAPLGRPGERAAISRWRITTSPGW